MRKGCDRHLKIAILHQFLTFDVRAKGLRSAPQTRNFTSVFDVRCPFRAKGLRSAPQTRNFTSVFDVRRPFRAKGLRFVAVRRHHPRLKRERKKSERETYSEREKRSADVSGCKSADV